MRQERAGGRARRQTVPPANDLPPCGAHGVPVGVPEGKRSHQQTIRAAQTKTERLQTKTERLQTKTERLQTKTERLQTKTERVLRCCWLRCLLARFRRARPLRAELLAAGFSLSTDGERIFSYKALRASVTDPPSNFGF